MSEMLAANDKKRNHTPCRRPLCTSAIAAVAAVAPNLPIPSPRKSAEEAAAEYLQRGWAVIPVKFQSKNPGFDEWQNLRLTESSVGKHFDGSPQNVGVLLGEPSDWLVDVDLDHAVGVSLAPHCLPPPRRSSVALENRGRTGCTGSQALCPQRSTTATRMG